MYFFLMLFLRQLLALFFLIRNDSSYFMNLYSNKIMLINADMPLFYGLEWNQKVIYTDKCISLLSTKLVAFSRISDIWSLIWSFLVEIFVGFRIFDSVTVKCLIFLEFTNNDACWYIKIFLEEFIIETVCLMADESYIMDIEVDGFTLISF